MLTDMERKQEQALKVLRQQVLEATLDMEREEAAEFFGELADWAIRTTGGYAYRRAGDAEL